MCEGKLWISEWRIIRNADVSIQARRAHWMVWMNHMWWHSQTPDLNQNWAPMGDFVQYYAPCIWSNVVDSALHHHQNIKWGSIIWKNGVCPSIGAAKMWRIWAKKHWSCSGCWDTKYWFILFNILLYKPKSSYYFCKISHF